MIYLYIALAILVLFLIFTLMTLPRRRHVRPDDKPLGGVYYAHRGLHNNGTPAPENTLPAFEMAARAGYGIELDTQLTRDGQVVVFHDETLLRACGTDRKIGELTYQELCQYHLFGSYEHVPLFSEVLGVVAGRVPLIVELKSHNRLKETTDKTLDLLMKYRGVYCIESFHPLMLYRVRKRMPKALRGQLSARRVKPDGSKHLAAFVSSLLGVMLGNLCFNFLSRPDFIAYRYDTGRTLGFKLCKRLGKPITVAWTVRAAEDFEDTAKKFDMVIFEGFIPPMMIM
jgi:glycerophosphoryl diester phosphodiesterase